MADMGFLPCVRRIVDQCNSERQTMLFSATLDGATDGLARTHLNNPTRHSVAPKVEDEGKATHLFWATNPIDRPNLSAEIIRKAGRTMLFTRTKHGADRLTEKLNAMGVQAAVIHGGRSQAQRDKSLSDFHRGRVAALVATDVAARGLHVEKVACVVHVDLPDSPTDYQHRSGRTARAGERGVVVSLVTPEQRRHAKNVQRHFGFPSANSRPDMDHIEAGEVPVIVDRPVRPERDDRPSRPYGDRPSRPYGQRDDRPARPYGQRDDRPARPYGQRDDRPARPAGDRDDRPARPYADRDARPARPYGSRDDRPASRPYGNREDRPVATAAPAGAPRRGGRPGTVGAVPGRLAGPRRPAKAGRSRA
jgi:superfamily II DNA/RNA helicase